MSERPVEIGDCVTMAQFDEMKQSMQELTNNVQAIMAHLQDPPRDNANVSHHEEEVDETKEEAAT
jgi:hypothetical protein